MKQNERYRKKVATTFLMVSAMSLFFSMHALAGAVASGVDLSQYQANTPGTSVSSPAGTAVGTAPTVVDQSIGTHYATVQSAEINAQNPASIDIMVNAGALVGSGQQLYLFAVKPYQMDLSGRTDYLAVQDVGNGSLHFTADLQDGPTSFRSYDAFVVAIATGAGYQIVSNRCYIGNPELVAADQSPALNRGKKGLLVNPNILDDQFLADSAARPGNQSTVECRRDGHAQYREWLGCVAASTVSAGNTGSNE